jgi:hypothetical protein
MMDSASQLQTAAVTLAAGNRHRHPRAKSAAWWTLIALSIATDLLVLPTTRLFSSSAGFTLTQAVLTFGMFGSTLAQGSLLAAGLVWSEGCFHRRLLWHWIIAGGLCCIWLIGLALAAPPHKFQEIGFTVALTVPVVSLGAQLPLWMARLLFGWRLVRCDSAAADQPLTIRDLMIATLLVAASFGVARLSPAAQQEQEFRIAWGLFMTAAATFSLFAILPAAPLLLRSRPFGRAVMYGLAFAAVPIILLWSVVGFVRFYGLVRLPPWMFFLGLTCLVLCYALTAILAAAVARDHGYWLAWGRTPATCQAALAVPPAA